MNAKTRTTKHASAPLTIYSASAGSGKTFRLAVEYIKLLIADPTCYRNILAVTFTNKATEEMKMRILEKLYAIANRLPDGKTYMQVVTRELGVTEDFASSRASLALYNLIHNYSYFRVETIDAFFQRVLRNLARELNLNANLHVDLNDKLVEQRAVDELVESLDNNNDLLRWILDYIGETIDDDKSWNVIGSIKSFGENIFKDFYKENREQLNQTFADSDFFTRFRKQLGSLKGQAEQTLKSFATRFFDVLTANGYNMSDFTRGASGPCSYFKKLGDGIYDGDKLLTNSVRKAMESADAWVNKAHQRDGDPLYALARNTLLPMLNQCEHERPALEKTVKSVSLTLRHINQLRLLQYIDRKVADINADSNAFLLSNTQDVLQAIIGESDSPFIYEKIGTQLDHIMIDEFQDTSTVQWHNFKVLLDDCMSRANTSSLIVGDVKQSIYRWRSGDWRLLNDIGSQFPHHSFADCRSSHNLSATDADVRLDSLDVNYRSCRRIVEFNNAFFQFATDAEGHGLDDTAQGDLLHQAYHDTVQKVPADKPADGSVHIELLPAADYEETTCQHTCEEIRRLLSLGVESRDIAVLVRKNDTIQHLANYLAEEMPEVPLVSDEAFRLDSSLPVNLMIAAMRSLLDKDDLLTRATLAEAYQTRVMDNDRPPRQLPLTAEDIDTLLPPDFAHGRETLLSMPLVELAERLYDLFQLSRLAHQSAYVCAFYDQLHRFVADNTADVGSFLEAWDETLHKKTIQSDDKNGIQLITIHKSKGLEFDHVLMPFCDWMLERTDTTIWCKPVESPYNELPIVPVDYSKSGLCGSIYENDYREEHFQNVVDNLNLLYVAFTRARKSLTVMGRRAASNSRSSLIEQFLSASPELLPDVTLTGDADDKKSVLSLDYGSDANVLIGNSHSPAVRDHAADSSSSNVFTRPMVNKPVEVVSYESRVQFHQSNKSRDFIADVAGGEEQREAGYVKMGTLLHNVFASIRTRDDIEPALRRLEADGVLADEDVPRDKLLAMLHKRLESKQVADWFSPRWTLFNECSILTRDDRGHALRRRPDRVMTDGRQMMVVDFKFATPTEEHHSQVRQYMHLLSAMGYRQVSGYLWYVYTNKIVEVK